MIDISANGGSQALAGATCAKLGNPADNGTGKLDLIFGRQPENERTSPGESGCGHAFERILSAYFVKLAGFRVVVQFGAPWKKAQESSEGKDLTR